MKGVAAVVTVVIVTLLLRSTALSALAARGLVIDVLALATAVWALRNGETWGASCGFFLGLAADLDAAHWLGRHALVLAILGYAIGRLSRTLVRESSRTHWMIVLAATLIHQVWSATFEFGGAASLPYLIFRVALASIATSVLGTLAIGAARRLLGRPLFGHDVLEPGSKN